MLTQFFLNRALVVSGVLWCAAGITAGMLRGTEMNAPPPAPAAPPVVLASTVPKADRLPLATPPPPFDALWPVMTSEPVAATAARKDVLQTVGATVSARRRHHDPVCDKGRTHFTRHHHRYWRCRR
ncbi:hypothetical protein ABH975_003427 [Bradyrhizobium ottawaense]|uniref:hypothetical protein n=1 Tax=Bradyrhizobium ottawaense TaxID=931866 RepID=UPI00351592B2